MVGLSLEKGVKPEGSKFRIFVWLVLRGSVTKRAEGLGKELSLRCLHPTLGHSRPQVLPISTNSSWVACWEHSPEQNRPCSLGNSPFKQCRDHERNSPKCSTIPGLRGPDCQATEAGLAERLLQKVGPLSSIIFTRRFSTLRSEVCPRTMRLPVIGFKKSFMGFPGGAVVESLPANAADTGSSPGLGRSHMPRSN